MSLDACVVALDACVVLPSKRSWDACFTPTRKYSSIPASGKRRAVCDQMVLKNAVPTAAPAWRAPDPDPLPRNLPGSTVQCADLGGWGPAKPGGQRGWRTTVLGRREAGEFLGQLPRACLLVHGVLYVVRSHLVELSLDKKCLIQKLEGGKIRKLSILTGFFPKCILWLPCCK